MFESELAWRKNQKVPLEYEKKPAYFVEAGSADDQEPQLLDEIFSF